MALQKLYWEAEVGRFLSLRPNWSAKQVPAQQELHRRIKKEKQKTVTVVIIKFYFVFHIKSLGSHMDMLNTKSIRFC